MIGALDNRPGGTPLRAWNLIQPGAISRTHTETGEDGKKGVRAVVEYRFPQPTEGTWV